MEKNHNKKITIPVMNPGFSNKSQNGRTMKENGDEMYTLTKTDVHGVAIEILDLYNGTTNSEFVGTLGTIQSTKRCGAFNVVERITGCDMSGNEVLDVVNTSHTLNVGMVTIADPNDNKEHPDIFVKLSEDVTVYAIWYEKYNCYVTIRKLTPKECFRLQAFPDYLYERAAFVNSDSQLYHQIGNSVTCVIPRDIGFAIGNAEIEQDN